MYIVRKLAPQNPTKIKTLPPVDPQSPGAAATQRVKTKAASKLSVQPRIVLPGSDKALFDSPNAKAVPSPAKTISISVIVRRKNTIKVLDRNGKERLTRAQYRLRYGADPAALRLVRTFAKEYGLQVAPDTPGSEHCTLKLIGTVAAMQRAFGVTLSHKTLDGKTYRIREGSITVPYELVGPVQAVLGLDNRPQARPGFIVAAQYSVLRSGIGFAAPEPNATTSYTPPQVAALYRVPVSSASGQTIGIVALGGGYRKADITSYFKALGQAPPKVVSISVDGAINKPSSTDITQNEVTVDIEVAASVAPGAGVVVYFAPNTSQGFVNAVNTAIHDTKNNPSVISISWGAPEMNWTDQALTSLDSVCQSAAACGITIVAASGDYGALGGMSNGRAHVEFPASSPSVLACGGTSLKGNGHSIGAETAWNTFDGGVGATGGGVSDFFPKPWWQLSANVPTSNKIGGGRGVPDVAANADPNTGYLVRINDKNIVVGGTSAAAPLWAGLIAVLNAQNVHDAGFINPIIYSSEARCAFNDIVSGTNGMFTARSGWDPCTGLGTPIAPELLRVVTLSGKRKSTPTTSAPLTRVETPSSVQLTAKQNFTPHNDGTTKVRLFFATDREQTMDKSAISHFGPKRSSSDALGLGVCEVSIPKLHQMGKLEHPSIFRLELRPNPEKHIVLTKTLTLDKQVFLMQVREAVSRSPSADAFVFIHGFNTSFKDAARRTGQIAFDLDFLGAPIFYSWPSNDKLRDYLKDESNVEWSTPHFKDFMELLAQESGAKRIHIIAHSMGNHAVCGALDALSHTPCLLKIDHLILAAPDMDAGVFRHLAAALKAISGKITIYESSNDKALLASKAVHGNPRAGEPIVIIPGIDTIDATEVDTDFLAHSVFADTWALLADIHSVFAGEPADQRFGLKEMSNSEGKYYAFRS